MVAALRTAPAVARGAAAAALALAALRTRPALAAPLAGLAGRISASGAVGACGTRDEDE